METPILDNIKDPEVEAAELEAVLQAVGESLRKSSTRRTKSGLTYSQFKNKKMLERRIDFNRD